MDFNQVVYQIYPLGFCGAPKENDGILSHRILKVIDWIPHFKKAGITSILFNPVFESDRHGYDTRNYTKIDCRLGTNEDFQKVCTELNNNGISIILDGVFNHVGRGFWAFQDVLEKRWDSPYKDWFHISFDGNSNYNDGLWYEGWEGNYDLVKLNLRNEDVIQHIFSCIKGWVEEFDIDGLRLDVAYCLDHDFLRRLRSFCDGLKPDFFLVGETLHGDYNQWMNDSMLHSVTNYECYKGLYSSFNSMNMFEINHSLLRQFGPDNWTLYKGKHLLSFVDNHDVTRVASILSNENHLPLIYALAFGMPGIPCVYYGSEWGMEGTKNWNDTDLRPEIKVFEWNELTDTIQKLIHLKHNHSAITYGYYTQIGITNTACIYQRQDEKECLWICMNMKSVVQTLGFNGQGNFIDMETNEELCINNALEFKPYEVRILKKVS